MAFVMTSENKNEFYMEICWISREGTVGELIIKSFNVEVEARGWKIEKKLFIQSRFSSACCLMQILHIHLMIYVVECAYICL